MRRVRGTQDTVIDALIYLVMILFSISIIYPFWYLLVDSFNTPAASVQDRVKLWPREITFENYRQVFANEIVGRAYINTILKTVIGTGAILFVTFTAAFGLTDRKMPLVGPITFLMVFTIFFSGGLIPTYLWYRQLGLINNPLVWVLHTLANAYYILIMRNFFREIPQAVMDSATIDGATLYQTLMRIVLPMSTPAIATIALWAAVQHWNDWFFPLIFTPQRELTVLQVLMRKVLVENQLSQVMELLEEEEARRTTEETVKAALLFVSMGPILLAYPFLQRYFVRGIRLGAVKG